jgi:hypothetical protein
MFFSPDVIHQVIKGQNVDHQSLHPIHNRQQQQLYGLEPASWNGEM